jgi:anaerobic magnesium-protoporphyrin IX monomethyl ester cyclase
MTRGGTLWYPIWLAYAAGALESAGRKVRLVDAPAWDWDVGRVLRDIQEFSPQMLVVDSNFSTLSSDCRTADELSRSVPGTITVLVGPPTAQYATQILSEHGIDAVARLEYDHTLVELALALENGEPLEHVAGISFKRDSHVTHNPDRGFLSSEELDRIPFVSRAYKEHLDLQRYALDHTLHPEVQIFSGRGCPNRCTFCSWPENLMGRQYRARSVPNFVDEMQYVSEELPAVREIFIEDDTFTIDTHRVKDICQEIRSRGLKVTWSCNARASLDLETMKQMRRAGCRLLDVGYESGSDEILRRIRKGVTSERMRQFAEDARRAGLMVLGDFIVGLPGETAETVQQTIRFAKELRPNLIQFAVATPLPGTQFYDWARAEGVLLTDDLEQSLDDSGFQRCIVSYPEFSAADIENWVDAALKSYYLSPSYVPIALSNVLRRDGLHELAGLVKSAGIFFQYLRRQRQDTGR